MRLAAALLLALPFAAPRAQPAPAAARKTKILVFDFAVKGEAAKDLGRVLADVAARELAKLSNVQALTQADVTAQLGVERQKTMLGCAEDRSCMAEIAGAIDADRTLGGSVVQLGDASLVSVTYVDARRAATLGGDQETLRRATMEELVAAVRRLAFYAATGLRLDTTGAIVFDVAEPGAKVLLDGEEVGTGPYAATRRANEGTHRVTVAKEGFATWESELRVAAGGTITVAPKLTELPKLPAVQQVTVIQQLAPAPDRFRRWSMELRMALTRALKYETTGVPACSDSLSRSICMGPMPSLRAGYRFDGTWEVGAAAGFFSYARSDDAVGYADLGGFGLGVTGAWHPLGNRWFALGGEVGIWRATAEVSIGDTASVSTSSVRPYGALEGRADLPLGNLFVGLRTGVVAMTGGDGATLTALAGNPQTEHTLAVSDGAVVLWTIGVGAGARF